MPLLNEGDPAPDFTARDHTGQEVRLADLRGRPVVLWFYPMADTPGCTIEGCGFRDKHAEYAARGAVVLGVSVDEVPALAAFVEKYGFPYRLLSDADRKISLAYGAADDEGARTARRITYVIDAEGKIAAVWGKVDVKAHADEVLARLG